MPLTLQVLRSENLVLGFCGLVFPELGSELLNTLKTKPNSLRVSAVCILLTVVVCGLACGRGNLAIPPEDSVTVKNLQESVEPKPAPTQKPEENLPSPTTLGSLLPISDVAERVKPWVASISVETVFQGIFRDFTDQGAGSGIVVRPNGYIVTNAHVVQGARDIKVHVDGQTYDGKVVGIDDVTDLALVKINAEDLPTARFAASSDIKVGEWVISLGNALSLKGGPTLTVGIISALGRTIQTDTGEYFYNLIQTDAAMNDGSSGGPLVNLNGEVVGINQAILRQAMGMAFAVNASEALPVIKSLIEHGRVVRPRIGLDGDDVTPAISARFRLGVLEGVLVTSLAPQGPAHKAGIRLGDVLAKMDGVPTPNVSDWLGLLWAHEVGDEVQIEYVRNGLVKTTMVTLAERE